MENKNIVSYPCRWTYSIIGHAREHLESAAQQIMPHTYEITDGLASSGNKYVSIRIHIEVHNENMRNEIFQALQAHEAIKMVL